MIPSREKFEYIALYGIKNNILFNIPKADFMLKNTGKIIIAISITNTFIGFFNLDDKNRVNPTIPSNTVYEITILYKSD